MLSRRIWIKRLEHHFKCLIYRVCSTILTIHQHSEAFKMLQLQLQLVWVISFDNQWSGNMWKRLSYIPYSFLAKTIHGWCDITPCISMAELKRMAALRCHLLSYVMDLNIFPVPNTIHNSVKLSWLKELRLNTTTSVSIVQIKAMECPYWAAWCWWSIILVSASSCWQGYKSITSVCLLLSTQSYFVVRRF